MPDKCTVLSCKSNYKSTIHKTGYVPVFRFPKDDRRQKWIEAVSREGFNPTFNSVICVRHFKEEYINRSRPRISLKSNAIPTERIEKVPQYLRIEKMADRTNPCDNEIKTEFITHHNERSEDSLSQSSDTFEDYEEFRENVLNKCQTDQWNIALSDDHTVFYTTDFDWIPRISSAVKISKNLECQVYIYENRLDKEELEWVIPHSGKVNKYSQVESILLRYRI